jgi:predicted GNAT family acetyltransferase
VRAVGAVIRDRGDVPFLHTTRDNTGAIRVYEAMGFVYRRSLQFAAYQVP